MIRIYGHEGDQSLHMVALVAFDRVSGEVYGTYVHGSLRGPDASGAKRGGERLLEEVAGRLGGSDIAVDLLEVPFDQFPTSGIVGVDPETRRLQPVREVTGSPPRLDRP
jgi:hypothetical protein